jgi:hypothetical protein
VPPKRNGRIVENLQGNGRESVMGVVKGAAKHKGKKTIENATEDMGVVGEVIDNNISSGPLDKAGDTVNKATDDLGMKKDRRDRR